MGEQAGIHRTIVAENHQQRYVCSSDGFEYVPDSTKHQYGISTRKPLEDMFLGELEFFRTLFPGYDIFTLGASTVLGERFITYLTICEFQIETEDDFVKLRHALRESDLAIRRKLGALWKWDIAARKGMTIAFMVGHLDLAYFLQHRKEFATKAHSRYMASFTNDSTVITSRDFKVLHSGEIVPFDMAKLDAHDKFVVDNIDRIKFEYESVA